MAKGGIWHGRSVASLLPPAVRRALLYACTTTSDELGHKGIRVNSVCPGLVETELASALLETPPVLEDYLNCMPIGRHGTVNDIASAVRFLCGPESSWITGVVLSVDGGHHLRRGPNLTPFVPGSEG